MMSPLAGAPEPLGPGGAGEKWATPEIHWSPLASGFPIPPLPVESYRWDLSSGCRQRAAARRAVDKDINHCLGSLNWLAGKRATASDRKLVSPSSNAIHEEVHARVSQLVRDRARDAVAIPLRKAAFRELLGTRSVYDLDERSNLANFSTVDCVSLPKSLAGCPRLADVLPEGSRHYLENFQCMLKPSTLTRLTRSRLLRIGILYCDAIVASVFLCSVPC